MKGLKFTLQLQQHIAAGWIAPQAQFTAARMKTIVRGLSVILFLPSLAVTLQTPMWKNVVKENVSA